MNALIGPTQPHTFASLADARHDAFAPRWNLGGVLFGEKRSQRPYRVAHKIDTPMRHFFLYILLLFVGLAIGATLMGALYVELELTLPHDKFVKYGALLGAVILLIYVARRSGLRRTQLGFPAHGTPVFHLLGGFGITLLFLLPLWGFLLYIGAREMDLWLWSTEVLYRAGIYLLIGLAVATLEEFYFRGLLLSDTSFPRPGILALGSTLLYAAVHFLDVQSSETLANQWQGGWLMLMQATMHLPDELRADWPYFTLLILIGLGLSLIRLHFGTLMACIGAHAAMIFSLKMFQKFTDAGSSPIALFSTEPTGGWAGVLWLGLLVIILSEQFNPRSKRRH